ncbi:hypothetical protein A5893_07440 [Pedobacter psychrophilus]|uniref:Uncharacterized protein n=1 Tax=Pedobacter psychrophilus TaxID=1826909 RepID=A0A179DK36_9SPHI|nr:hypothetical protein [Pedobacter psychrophilus]OAQ40763.1 hypothetical protein A5893_07440 [Pedobacter psychrophilus]
MIDHNKVADREAIIWSYQIIGINPEEEGDAINLEKVLADYLDNLVVQDLNLLFSILYRIDISQEKAVSELSKNSEKETAGETLARLVIQRQKEKLYYRNLYKINPSKNL